MLHGGVLERPNYQVEEVASHFPILGHWVKVGEFDRIDALDVLEFVQITLVNGPRKQGANA